MNSKPNHKASLVLQGSNRRFTTLELVQGEDSKSTELSEPLTITNLASKIYGLTSQLRWGYPRYKH